MTSRFLPVRSAAKRQLPIVEHAFDEDGIEDCRRAPPRRSRRYRPDDSGKNDIVTVRR